MKFFEIAKSDISQLNDGDLRDLIGRLCEAELSANHLPINAVTFGGKQEATDGGVDVRVDLNIDTDKLEFICRPQTIIQVKKHDLQPAACLKEMQNSDESVRQVIIDIAQSNGAYIIASGAADCSDLMRENRLKKMREAVAGLPEKDQLLLDYYDGNRIASWLSKYPSLTLWVRDKIGKPLSGWQGFAPWATGNINQDQPFLSQSEKYIRVRMTTGETTLSALAGINYIRKKLHENQQAIRIIGLSGVGKTRFVQALFEKNIGENPLHDTHVLYADAGKDLDPTPDQAIAQFQSNDGSTIFMVVDNCSAQLHRDLVKTLGALNHIKIITIEHDIQDDEPEGTDIIHIDAIDDEVIAALIKNRFADLGLVNAGTIARLAGGNARVALILAEHVEKHENLSQLSDSVLFERIFHQNKLIDKDLLKHAEVFSLVYSFNINRSILNDELGQLALIIDENRRKVLRSKSELLRRHLMQKRGDWRAILPHAIANYLAKRALENIDYNEINEIILKPENSRLLKSCGHRIGYLHDSEQAIKLANSWLDNGALLNDFATLNADQMACLYHITPLFPALILNKIEETVTDTLIDNQNAITFIDLLRHIAYDECHFDRAIEILLSFTESPNGLIKTHAIDTIASFYSLYFSGTHASLDKRIAILNTLILSSHPLKYELIDHIFSKALKTSNFSTSRSYGFGAKKRDFGSAPNSIKDHTIWFITYIKQLKKMLNCDDITIQSHAKRIVEKHLENFPKMHIDVNTFADLISVFKGKWNSLYPKLKMMQKRENRNSKFDNAKELGRLASNFEPKNLEDKIDLYIFTPINEYVTIYDNKEELCKHLELIIEIGEQCAGNIAIFTTFNNQLFTNKTDALTYFGRGLARSTKNIQSEFDFILSQITNCKNENFNPALLTGFLTEVHKKDAILARQFLNKLSYDPFWQKFYLNFLNSTEITELGILRAIELFKAKKLQLSSFKIFISPNPIDLFSDTYLVNLIDASSNDNIEIEVLFDLIENRFYYLDYSQYKPNPNVIIALQKKLITSLKSTRAYGIIDRLFAYKTIIKCLFSSYGDEASRNNLLAAIIDTIKKNRILDFRIGIFLAPLIANYNSNILDQLFALNKIHQFNYELIFDEIYNPSSLTKSFSITDFDNLVLWCKDDCAKYMFLAQLFPIFNQNQEFESGEPLALSGEIKEFVNRTPFKKQIIKTIFKNINPMSRSEPLSDVLERRKVALAEFLHHPIEEVRIEATKQLQNLDNQIIAAQKKEQEDFKDEQGFE